MDIFLDKEDYLFFLKRIKEALYPPKPQTMMPIVEAEQTKQWASLLPRRKQIPSDTFDLLLYCLMPNHFHLAIQQKTDLPISVLVSKVCTSYSKYFNKKYSRVGSLYQDQFKAVHVDSNEQLLWLAAYIHRNPLMAGLVKDLNDYSYSSHLDYIGLREGTLCNKDLILGQYQSVEDYKSSVIGVGTDLLASDLRIDDYEIH